MQSVVEIGKEYIFEITGMNHEGQGVGRVSGLAVFADNALIGEKVKVRILKVSKNYAVGELTEIMERSENRTIPFCSSYEECGGCSLQHMSYEAQLEFKKSLVNDAVSRIGKLENVLIHNTLGMNNPTRYRNKAQFPAAMGEAGVSIGFFARRSHQIIAGSSCHIQDEMSDRIRDTVKNYMDESGLSAYDETSGKGLVRHVMTRVGFKTGQVMVAIVINGQDIPNVQKLVEKLKQLFQNDSFYKLASVYININTKATNIILGEKNKLFYGTKTITDYISDLKFEISPLSFFQVNPAQTEVLYTKALEYAGLSGSETVFDLYCGIGTISLFLSRNAKKVYGVESVPDAIKDAKRNARLNNIENVEFYTGEAETVVPKLYEEGVKADVVVVDPPRKGCDQRLLETLVEMNPQKIVYVSCNPSTLARDLNFLDAHGLKAVEIQPVDMFPHTTHVETIVLIQRAYTSKSLDSSTL